MRSNDNCGASGSMPPKATFAARTVQEKRGRNCRPYQVDRDRSGPKPTIRIGHHKTGAIIDHRVEADGVAFYADAEEALAKLPPGYQWSFANLKTGTPSRSRSTACNTSFSACVNVTGEVDYVEALAH
jgi:hypothetical protein